MSTPVLRVIKLVSGEDIIGVVRDGSNEESDDENYTLDNLIFVTNPMKIVSEYNQESKVHALYLVDWVPAIRDSTLPIDKQRVVTLGQPNKDLEAHYIDLVLLEKFYHEVAQGEEAQDDGSAHEEAINTAPTQDIHEALEAVEEAASDDDSDAQDAASDPNLTDEQKLAEKLKKHKFDDDDIQ